MRIKPLTLFFILMSLVLSVALVHAGTSTKSWFVGYGTLAPEWVAVGGQSYNPMTPSYLIPRNVDVPLTFSIKCPGGDCDAVTVTLSRTNAELEIIGTSSAPCNAQVRGVDAGTQCLTTWTMHPTIAFPSSIIVTATACSSLSPYGVACQTTSPINISVAAGAVCNADCTSTLTPNYCVAACDGVNGCAFYNTTIATALDGIASNVTYIPPSSTWSLLTCEGSPTPFSNPAQIKCPTGETLLIYERIVIKDSKPVKLVVPVCKKSEVS